MYERICQRGDGDGWCSIVNAAKAVKCARENAKDEIANPTEVTIVDRKKLIVDEMN